MSTAPGLHGSICHTTSRRSRRCTATSPCGRRKGSPRRSTTRCGERFARRPAGTPNPPRRSWTRRQSRPRPTYPNTHKESTQAIIKGTKRHIATDVLGLLLVVLVTAASVHDTVGGRALVQQVAQNHPQVTVAWADSGYKQSVIDIGTAYGIDVQVVTKDPQQRGFVPQRKRWAVERTFGWLMLHRRLVRDYETNPRRSRAMIHWAMIDNMSRRLTGESTSSWRNDPLTDTDIA